MIEEFGLVGKKHYVFFSLIIFHFTQKKGHAQARITWVTTSFQYKGKVKDIFSLDEWVQCKWPRHVKGKRANLSEVKDC